MTIYDVLQPKLIENSLINVISEYILTMSPPVVTLDSEGPSAEYWGDCFGEYELQPGQLHGGHLVYRQRGEGAFLYR